MRLSLPIVGQTPSAQPGSSAPPAAVDAPPKSPESKTENVIAAKKAGVNNYIVKPFNGATLKNKIEAVFPDNVPA